MNKLASLLAISLLSACSASVIHEENPIDAGTLSDTGVNTVHEVGDFGDTGFISMPPTPVDGGVVTPPSGRDAGPPVPCPGSVSGDGLACDSPGSGCGTASSGGCATTVSCVCGEDLLWSCVASTPDGCDGGTSTPPSDDGGVLPPFEDGGIAPPPFEDAGVCTVVGTWSFRSAAFPTLVIRFESDGEWEIANTAADLLSMPITGGTFTLSGGQISLIENLVAHPPSGCSPSQAGVYDLGFSPDCHTLALSDVMDPCPGRASDLSTAVFIAM